MGLRENAIEAYKKERELIEERDKIEAETFSRRALDALSPETNVLSKTRVDKTKEE